MSGIPMEVENWTRALLNAMPGPVLLLDENSKVVFQNTAAGKIRTLAGSELPAVQWEGVLSAGSVTSLQAEDGQGRPRIIDAAVATIKEDGALLHLVNLHDITLSTDIERETGRYPEREMNDFVAEGVLQRLGSTLTVLMGEITIAKMGVGKAAGTRENLIKVERSCQVAAGLVKRLRQLGAGKSDRRFSSSMNKFLHDSLVNWRPVNNVSLSFDIDDDLGEVGADWNLLKMALFALLENGAEATPEGGVLELRAARVKEDKPGLEGPGTSGQMVRLSVGAPGVMFTGKLENLPPECCHKASQKGSGLRMAVVREVAEQHFGRVLTEDRPGGGTFVHILIPAGPAFSTPDSEESDHDAYDRQLKPSSRGLPGKQASGVRGSILIMDDNHEILDNAGMMLEMLDYRVFKAGDGRVAVEMYREALAAGKPYDAVILDLIVPCGMGGMETHQELLRMDRNVKVIVSSGLVDSATFLGSCQKSIYGALSKPYNSGQLATVLAKVLGQADLGHQPAVCGPQTQFP